MKLKVANKNDIKQENIIFLSAIFLFGLPTIYLVAGFKLQMQLFG